MTDDTKLQIVFDSVLSVSVKFRQRTQCLLELSVLVVKAKLEKKRSLPSHHLGQEDQHLLGDLSDPLVPRDHLLLWVLLVQALPGKHRNTCLFILTIYHFPQSYNVEFSCKKTLNVFPSP